MNINETRILTCIKILSHFGTALEHLRIIKVLKIKILGSKYRYQKRKWSKVVSFDDIEFYIQLENEYGQYSVQGYAKL